MNIIVIQKIKNMELENIFNNVGASLLTHNRVMKVGDFNDLIICK